jgi:hypothetical protein
MMNNNLKMTDTTRYPPFIELQGIFVSLKPSVIHETETDLPTDLTDAG